jgi:L-alanine-DL-glutamate epimerase-like enolase superfamily enzyme
LHIELEFHHLRLPRKRFEIASGVKDVADVFIVEVRHGPYTGLGAGTPATSMGDSISNCHKGLIRARNLQIDPRMYFEEEEDLDVRDISPAAAAALDIAMWDLYSKSNGVNLAAAIGESAREIPTGATIDLKLPVDAGKDAARLAKQGFKTVKVKVGRQLSEDLERIKMVREAVGSGIHIFADANGGYSLGEALKFWEEAAAFGLEFFEQPVPKDKTDDLATLRRRGVKVCADESVLNEESLAQVIEQAAADIINIKLMKCGGISSAIEMAGMARDEGIEIMVGCMGDIGISIAAAAHFACAIEAEHIDLDSHLNISQVCDGPEVGKGSILLKDEPGHGTHLLEKWGSFKVVE